jgi:TrmH family RNA methyltransferase
VASSAAERLGQRVDIVLVEPQSAGNVGAAARAMRNFGLERLWLVRPAAWDPETARWMAPGCEELIAAARVVDDIDDVFAEVSNAVATTARHRRGGAPVYDPASLATSFAERPGRLALLFGREDHGLDRATVDRCGALLRIPTGTHASLNLAAAVLIVAYALHAAEHAGRSAPGRTLGGSRRTQSTAAAQKPDARDLPATVAELEPLVAQWMELLDASGTTRTGDPQRAASAARRWLQRASTSRRETAALRGALRDALARLGTAGPR